jgi:hypothetical protein
MQATAAPEEMEPSGQLRAQGVEGAVVGEQAEIAVARVVVREEKLAHTGLVVAVEVEVEEETVQPLDSAPKETTASS